MQGRFVMEKKVFGIWTVTVDQANETLTFTAAAYGPERLQLDASSKQRLYDWAHSTMTREYPRYRVVRDD